MSPVTFFSGNKRTLYLGTQVAKGTPLATPTIAFAVEDFTPNDVRSRIQLSESDKTTQDPVDVVVGIQPGCTFKVNARPQQVAFLYASLLGATVNSGAGPNFVHTLTPTLATPYLSLYEVDVGLFCNRYADLRVTKIEATGSAGGTIELTVTCEALAFLAGVTAPTTPTPDATLPYVYPEVNVTKNAVYDGSRDQWSVTIDRGGKRNLGDAGLQSLDYVNGKFSVVGQLTQYMQSDAEQRQVDTGTTTGTTPTTAIYTDALTILVTRDANTSLSFAMPQVSYPSRAAAVQNDGTSIAEVIGFRTVPQATLAQNIVVVCKDQRATPDG